MKTAQISEERKIGAAPGRFATDIELLLKFSSAQVKN